MNNAQSGRGAAAQQREQAIGDYITACNAGDAEAVAATCTPDALLGTASSLLHPP